MLKTLITSSYHKIMFEGNSLEMQVEILRMIERRVSLLSRSLTISWLHVRWLEKSEVGLNHLDRGGVH